MNTDKDLLHDLLVKKAIHGLDETEQKKLDEFDSGHAYAEFATLEMTAAAIGLADLEVEPLPINIRERIEADAAKHFSETETLAGVPEPWPPSQPAVYDEPERKGSWFGWLGWAVAVAAAVALGLNLWLTRTPPPPTPEMVVNRPSTPEPPQTAAARPPADMRDDLVKTAADLLRWTWKGGNVKGVSDIVGEIVWSDEKQAGYMTFKNLPPNPPDQYTYQLWIMDQSQDKRTPIDGGTFNVDSNGEIVVPVDAKLKAHSPEMFAVTMEKPGGVVVSKREKIVVVAQAETTDKSGT